MAAVHPRKVPERLYEAVLIKAAEGLSARKIAAWLLEQHGIELSHTSVRNLLQDLHTERTTVSAAVVGETMARYVVSDLEVLGEVETTLLETFRALKGVENIRIDMIGNRSRASVLREIGAELRSVATKRLELAAGVAPKKAEETPLDLSTLSDDQLDQLDAILERATQAASTAGAGGAAPGAPTGGEGAPVG